MNNFFWNFFSKNETIKFEEKICSINYESKIKLEI